MTPSRACRVRFVVALAVALCVGTAAADEREERTLKLLDTGKAMYRDGKYDLALNLFREANELAPDPKVQYSMGLCLMKLERWKEAYAVWDRVEGKPELAPVADKVAENKALCAKNLARERARDEAEAARIAAAPKPAPPASSDRAPEARPAPAAPLARFKAGLDGAFVLPLSQWADSYSGVGFGALGRFEVGVSPIVSLTARVGYLFGLTAHDWSTNEIALLAGAKVFALGDRLGGLYMALELGGVHMTFTSHLPYGSSWTRFGVGGTAGLGYEVVGVDVRAQVFVPDLRHGQIVGVLATVGYAWSF